MNGAFFFFCCCCHGPAYRQHCLPGPGSNSAWPPAHETPVRHATGQLIITRQAVGLRLPDGRTTAAIILTFCRTGGLWVGCKLQPSLNYRFCSCALWWVPTVQIALPPCQKSWRRWCLLAQHIIISWFLLKAFLAGGRRFVSKIAW
jgi:hypothetical protein